MRKVVLSDERQKHVDTARFGWYRLLLLQKLAQNDITHAEPERRQIDAAHISKQRIVPSATADRAQGLARIEQLEDNPGVIGKPSHDREVNLEEASQPHGSQRGIGLPKRFRCFFSIGAA